MAQGIVTQISKNEIVDKNLREKIDGNDEGTTTSLRSDVYKIIIVLHGLIKALELDESRSHENYLTFHGAYEELKQSASNDSFSKKFVDIINSIKDNTFERRVGRRYYRTDTEDSNIF